VIGVSGGKDSTYQALFARDELDLRCLLVNGEADNITEIGRKNIENLKCLGFDVISIRPNPKILRELVKRDFYKYLNPVKVTEYTLRASAYIIASKFDVPLIIQGENPALSLGIDMPSDDNAFSVYLQDTLKEDIENYVSNTISKRDLFLYGFNIYDLTLKRAIWLSYYDKDWSPRRNAEFSMKHGLTVRKNFYRRSWEEIGTYVPWAQLDNDLVPVNQMFKYFKFGFGQCTDYCCYDIRDGLMTREEAWELVEQLDGKCGEWYIEKFCKYIDITESEMWKTVDKFRRYDPWGRRRGWK
jgi:N-acetyl sugar amidotransferase